MTLIVSLCVAPDCVLDFPQILSPNVLPSVLLICLLNFPENPAVLQNSQLRFKQLNLSSNSLFELTYDLLKNLQYSMIAT